MDDAAIDLLRQLVFDHGRKMTHDSRHCEALLRDRFGDRLRREQAVLVAAVRTQAAAALAAHDSRADAASLVAKLARRLHEEECIEAVPARWGVEGWAIALGVAGRRGPQADSRPTTPRGPAVRATMPRPAPPRPLPTSPPLGVVPPPPASPPVSRGTTWHGGRVVLLGTLGLLAALWLADPGSHDGPVAEAAPPPAPRAAPLTASAIVETSTVSAQGVGLVGIVMTGDEAMPFVVIKATVPGSPAARAGIAAGSRILRVNGVSARARTVPELAQAIRGPVGSRVRLDVALPGASTRSLELTRR